MGQLDIRLKYVAPFRALTSRHRFASHAEIGPVAAQIQEAVTRHGITLAGPPTYFIYGDEYAQRDIDVQFALPVAADHTDAVPLKTAGVMTVREIGGIDAACYTYQGNPDAVNDGLTDVRRWASANGYALAGVIRLVHLRGPFEGLPMSEWLIEVQHAVTKA